MAQLNENLGYGKHIEIYHDKINVGTKEDMNLNMFPRFVHTLYYRPPRNRYMDIINCRRSTDGLAIIEQFAQTHKANCNTSTCDIFMQCYVCFTLYLGINSRAHLKEMFYNKA